MESEKLTLNDLPEKIITQENISLINELFKSYDSVIIFGKGSSFKIIKKENNDILYICVNETINFIDNCDILTINDIETIKRINLDRLKNLKFIICPEYIHKNNKYDKNTTWRNLHNIIKNYFSGYWIIYNLPSNKKPNDKLINLPSGISGANTSNDFVCLFLNKFIKEINFYGIGIFNNKNYAPTFNKLTKLVYHKKYIYKIRNNIITKCESFNIKYIFN